MVLGCVGGRKGSDTRPGSRVRSPGWFYNARTSTSIQHRDFYCSQSYGVDASQLRLGFVSKGRLGLSWLALGFVERLPCAERTPYTVRGRRCSSPKDRIALHARCERDWEVTKARNCRFWWSAHATDWNAANWIRDAPRPSESPSHLAQASKRATRYFGASVFTPAWTISMIIPHVHIASRPQGQSCTRCFTWSLQRPQRLVDGRTRIERGISSTCISYSGEPAKRGERIEGDDIAYQEADPFDPLIAASFRGSHLAPPDSVTRLVRIGGGSVSRRERRLDSRVFYVDAGGAISPLDTREWRVSRANSQSIGSLRAQRTAPVGALRVHHRPPFCTTTLFQKVTLIALSPDQQRQTSLPSRQLKVTLLLDKSPTESYALLTHSPLVTRAAAQSRAPDRT